MTDIVEFNQTEAGLQQLRAELEGVVWDVQTTAGNKAARKAKGELVSLRRDLDARRLEAKRPHLEAAKQIDAEAKRITAEIVALEEPIAEQLDAEKERREAEKAAKAAEEKAWRDRRRADIDGIRGLLVSCFGGSSAELAEAIERLVGYEVTDDDYATEERVALSTTLAKLEDMHEAAVGLEERERQMEAERAELQRQKEEQEAAAEKAREEREAANRAELERLEAVRESIAEEERASKERIEAQEREARERREAEAAAERAERERIAEQERVERERAEAEAAAEKAERDRVEAEAERARQRRLDGVELLQAFLVRFYDVEPFVDIAEEIHNWIVDHTSQEGGEHVE